MASNSKRKSEVVAGAAGQKLFVTKPLHIDEPKTGKRRTFTVGEEFDSSLLEPRRLRQMVDRHYLDFNPPPAAEAAHGGAA